MTVRTTPRPTLPRRIDPELRRNRGADRARERLRELGASEALRQAADAGAYDDAGMWGAHVGLVTAPGSMLAEALVTRVYTLHAAGDDERARQCVAAALEARTRSDDGEMRALLRRARHLLDRRPERVGHVGFFASADSE